MGRVGGASLRAAARRGWLVLAGAVALLAPLMAQPVSQAGPIDPDAQTLARPKPKPAVKGTSKTGPERARREQVSNGYCADRRTAGRGERASEGRCTAGRIFTGHEHARCEQVSNGCGTARECASAGRVCTGHEHARRKQVSGGYNAAGEGGGGRFAAELVHSGWLQTGRVHGGRERAGAEKGAGRYGAERRAAGRGDNTSTGRAGTGRKRTRVCAAGLEYAGPEQDASAGGADSFEAAGGFGAARGNGDADFPVRCATGTDAGDGAGPRGGAGRRAETGRVSDH